MSRITNFAERQAIRDTWGLYQTRPDIALGFVIGLPDKEHSTNRTTIKQVENEKRAWKDIIQCDFIDTYVNLTLKVLASLEWSSKFCTTSKFILKVDDDVFLNVPRLLELIDKNEFAKNTIYGNVRTNGSVIRNPSNKYFLSHREFRNNTFPTYVSGPAYLMSGDIIAPLYARALQMRFLHLEDVLFTGIVANHLNISRVHEPAFINKRFPFTKCNVDYAISLHMIRPEEQKRLWYKHFNYP